MTGDFNLLSIDWNNMQDGYSVAADSLIDIMLTFHLDQIVRDYTRGNAILDLLFISGKFSSGKVQIEPGISDHDLIYFCWARYTEIHMEKLLQLQ